MNENKSSKFTIRAAAERLSENGWTFFFFALLMVVLMGCITLAVFFTAVKGEEEVMVPQLTGKDLTEALLEMQVKELYPRVSLRYSENPEDKNKVLAQSPAGGAIVKAGKRINLTVSRGTIVDKVEDFSGWKLEDVRSHLKTLFSAGSKALIVLADPLYEYNSAEAGTVLSQDPAPGMAINDQITMHLVVSRGPANETVTVPNCVGLGLNDVYAQMSANKLVFDFDTTASEEKSMKVAMQSVQAGTSSETYTRVNLTMAMPEAGGFNAPVAGIFSTKLPNYPFPLDVRLEAMPANGAAYKLVTFKHPGGNLSIPYSVAKNTVLILYVQNSEVAQITVKANEN